MKRCVPRRQLENGLLESVVFEQNSPPMLQCESEQEAITSAVLGVDGLSSREQEVIELLGRPPP